MTGSCSWPFFFFPFFEENFQKWQEGDLQWFNESDHVAEHSAGHAEEERRNGPTDGFVTLGVNAHALGLFLVVADGIDGQPEATGIHLLKDTESDDGEDEAESIKE